MNRVISLFKKIQIRQIAVVFLAGIAFFSFQAFGYGNLLSAQAGTLTPEAKSYQTESNYAGKEAVDTAKKQTGNALENIVEKLNLNEPTPQETKKFFNQVKESPVKALAPETGDEGTSVRSKS